MIFVLTSGERHETVAIDRLLWEGEVKQVGRGRPRQRSRYFIGDIGL